MIKNAALAIVAPTALAAPATASARLHGLEPNDGQRAQNRQDSLLPAARAAAIAQSAVVNAVNGIARRSQPTRSTRAPP